MDFSLDKEKAIEALVYVADKNSGVGRFHAAKILYFSERFHIQRYGRPIFGDRYIAMENGPVPSFVYDILKGTVSPDIRQLIEGAVISIDRFRHPTYEAGRSPRLEYFSKSDLECLDLAITHCRGRSFGSISDETHDHKAWSDANLNAPMKWDDILEGTDADIIEDAKVFAAYGVL
ncbi:Panacea domain-containing protein [Pararhizobium sp. DWP1-1-3]|uniref:Panacea domain-containing protein n=1 Tax=Pararhizobium sp. DWP1-1-3 TaxID=2804652 RepID=UPI003CF6C021